MEKQTFIQEMSCNFNLREPKAHKPTNIYFVVCIEGKQIKFSTGVKVYPEQWNKKKQELASGKITKEEYFQWKITWPHA